MFKAWNIINSMITGHTFGHVLWETKLLSEELQRRGTEVRLVGHRSIKAEDYPGARIVPAFDLHYVQAISEDPEWGYLENFVVHNLAYEKTLGKIDRGFFADSLTLIPDIGERQLLAIIRWLSRFEASKRPQVAMILAGPHEWSDTFDGLVRKIWAGCPDAVKLSLKLCVRSEMSAGKYEPVLGTRPYVLPSPLGPTDREIRAAKERIGAAGGPLTVSFLAGARPERGAALIHDLVKQCEAIGVRFLIQLTDPFGADEGLVSSLRSLRDSPAVQFQDGSLSRDAYNDWIAQSVVLLPYNAVCYQTRSSGVYVEAKGFGAPVIVPAGTWMAEEVSRLGNGLVFEEYSAASIARCIARAQGNLAALRERAAACAAEYHQQHGADRCVDAIEALFNDR
jgi:glycosyltransferase involved in cell wall biosynthesis